MFISLNRATNFAKACTVAAVVSCTLLYVAISLSKVHTRRRKRRKRKRRRVVVVEWQNLPADVLFLIAERSDIRHLRAVCSSWRSSLPLPSKAPHNPLLAVKIPRPSFIWPYERTSNIRGDGYQTLSELSIYCLEPLGNDLDSQKSSWIVKLEETSSGKMRFYNTLSIRSIPASKLNLPATVDLLDRRVVLVGKEYNLWYFKVVLSDDAMLCRFDDQKLGYFKFGDEHWTMIVDQGKDELSYFTTDIIYHKQKFYVVDRDGQIIVFDSSLKVEAFVSPVVAERTYGEWFFVQSDGGDLFVVNKYDVWNVDARIVGRLLVHFKVYRLTSDEQQWNEVTNLGDQSFFISNGGCTFSIGSGQFSGCGKNFIYFADRSRKDGRVGEPRYDVSIFNLKNKSSRSLHMISRYSRLFWPIPSWL